MWRSRMPTTYGRVLDLVLVEQPRAADEVHQQVVRDRADRAVERRRAHFRRQAHGAGALERHARLAVDVAEIQHVAGIDQVRIGDVRVDVPDLRPVPRVLEVHRGDVPQRVAPLDHVPLGRGLRDRHRHRAARLGLRQRGSRDGEAGADACARNGGRQHQGPHPATRALRSRTTQVVDNDPSLSPSGIGVVTAVL